MKSYRLTRDHVRRLRLVPVLVPTPLWLEHVRIGVAFFLALLLIPLCVVLYLTFGLVGWAVGRIVKS